MFGSSIIRRRELSTEDKRKTLLIIQEMRSRGIPIPANLEIPLGERQSNWNLDDNGYFKKVDGARFNPRQVLEDFINDRSRFILLKAGRGGGKALALDTPILTYSGWSTMGELAIGDYVFSENGNPVRVTDKSEVMYDHVCYKVKFNDGSEIIADAEHLWYVQSKKERSGEVKSTGSIRTTASMLQNVLIGKRKEPNYSIPTCKPLRFPSRSLPLHPYFLGVWLGDGNSSGARITSADLEILEHLGKFGIQSKKLSQAYDYSVFISDTQNTRNSKNGRMESNPSNIVAVLRSMSLIDNKHIPYEYLCASFEQRLELARGLMDTDGTVDERGHCEYTTTSYQLARDALELFLGLGIKATMQTGQAYLYGKLCSAKYRIYINTTLPIFRLTRKLSRLENGKKQNLRHENRHIVSIEEVKSVPVQCITVEGKNHLYLAGRTLIPTHNSASGAQKALKKVMQGESGAVMNPDFENFRTSTWPELQSWIPWDMVVPKHRYRASVSWEAIRPFTIVFMNGARIYCKGLKDPESARGANLNWFWYDEGRRDPTGLGWKNAIAFLRVGDNPQAWCTTTMASIDHWTNTFFQGEVTSEIRALIRELKERGIEQNMFSVYKTTTKENAENLDPMFYASLVSTYPSGYLRAREIDGEAADEGGSLGTREWFENKHLPTIPDWAVKFTRFWDLAATEKKILKGKKMNDPDETIGTLLGTDSERDLVKKRYVIADQCGGWLAWKQLKEFILEVSYKDIQDLKYVTICFEQEPASGGKNQVAELMDYLSKELKKRGVHSSQYKLDALKARDIGDRVMAANTWFSEANNGQFYYVNGLWTPKFFSQLDTFDGIKHDDRITSVTGARHNIAPIQKKFKSISFLSLNGEKPN